MPDSLPLSLYHKAKNLLWDPRHIDLTQDARDWAQLDPRERGLIRDLSARFLGGETAVAHDLAPLLVATRKRGADGSMLHDEMFLTTQLFEEAKHVEWFARWWAEVGGEPPPEPDGAYAALFAGELPATLNALLGDASDEAVVRAISTYHVIIEGVLAETGYHGYMRALKTNGLMPGTVEGVALVQRDEARHIAYGLHALQRILGARPELHATMQDTLNTLLPLALEIIGDVFAPYGEDVPFGIDPAEFVTYAAEQFDARLTVLERGH